MSELPARCPNMACRATMMRIQDPATEAEWLECSDWLCGKQLPVPESVRLREAGAPTLPGFEED